MSDDTTPVVDETTTAPAMEASSEEACATETPAEEVSAPAAE